MKISVPVYRLKQRAKQLSRAEGIPLHGALDRVAREQGYARWSLLAAQLKATEPARSLLGELQPGDLLLLGARPGHGKTRLALELILAAIRLGRRGLFFTLEYTPADVFGLFAQIGEDADNYREGFELDTSDLINADYIERRLDDASPGTVAVIDYLQLLDQRRDNPALEQQVAELKRFARARGLILVFISQIDRAFEASTADSPGLADIRLPNALDLSLFNKICFLHEGQLRLSSLN